jgi:hypothetical protein
MKWLIDEQSAAINEILVLIKKSIHFCEHTIARLSDEDIKLFFLRELKEYNVFLSDLVEFIRLKGELPRDPDSERETLEQWGVDFKALLSEDGEGSFLDRYGDLQQDLLVSVESARKAGTMPESIGGLLKDLEQHVAATSRDLQEWV